jgi:hypothetical protein
MMPTAVSAVVRSTPRLATRRPISSSIVPSPAPYFWHVLAILYAGLWRDKAAAPEGGDCRGILVRTARHVAKEQRSGGLELGDQAGRFKFWLRKRLFGIEKGSKERSAHKFHDKIT